MRLVLVLKHGMLKRKLFLMMLVGQISALICNNKGMPNISIFQHLKWKIANISYPGVQILLKWTNHVRSS